MRQTPHTRDHYPYTLDIQTRWNDNDVYGHVNNAIIYMWFDSVVNSFLIKNDLLEIGKSKTIGLVVETGCQYFAPLSYPEIICAGLRVEHIGTSSVRYEIAIFSQDQQAASAQGHFVHVYVDANTRKPRPVSKAMKQKLEAIS